MRRPALCPGGMRHRPPLQGAAIWSGDRHDLDGGHVTAATQKQGHRLQQEPSSAGPRGKYPPLPTNVRGPPEGPCHEPTDKAGCRAGRLGWGLVCCAPPPSPAPALTWGPCLGPRATFSWTAPEQRLRPSLHGSRGLPADPLPSSRTFLPCWLVCPKPRGPTAVRWWNEGSCSSWPAAVWHLGTPGQAQVCSQVCKRGGSHSLRISPLLPNHLLQLSAKLRPHRRGRCFPWHPGTPGKCKPHPLTNGTSRKTPGLVLVPTEEYCRVSHTGPAEEGAVRTPTASFC